MYRRILLTDDGSPISAAAIPYAGSLARLLKAEVVVLRISRDAGDAPESVDRDTWDRTIAADPTSTVLPDLEPTFGDLFSQLTSWGAGAIGSLVVQGEPRSAIEAVAKRLEADLVVMASHGDSGWKRAILGSVADHVSRNVDEIPVLLCRPLPSGCESPFDRIAVALDGSPFAAAALEHVDAIRSAAGGATQVIRIIEHEGAILSTAIPISATEPLPALSDKETPTGRRSGRRVDVEDLVVNGLRLERAEGGIAAGIISTARSTDCGTIVMSSRGRGGITRTLLGSTGDEVARGIEEGAVLLVRPPVALH